MHLDWVKNLSYFGLFIWAVVFLGYLGQKVFDRYLFKNEIKRIEKIISKGDMTAIAQQQQALNKAIERLNRFSYYSIVTITIFSFWSLYECIYGSVASYYFVSLLLIGVFLPSYLVKRMMVSFFIKLDHIWEERIKY